MKPVFNTEGVGILKRDKCIYVTLIANPGTEYPSKAADNLELAVDYLEKNGLKVDVALTKQKGRAFKMAMQAIKDKYIRSWPPWGR